MSTLTRSDLVGHPFRSADKISHLLKDGDKVRIMYRSKVLTIGSDCTANDLAENGEHIVVLSLAGNKRD